MKQLPILLVLTLLEPGASAQWTVDNLSQARGNLAATTVGSKVLFSGGFRGSGIYSSVVDMYDAGTGTWSAESLSLDRGELAATTVGDLAIFAGGRRANGVTARVDAYDDATGTWSTLADLSLARRDIAATSAGDRAFFAGGRAISQPTSRIDIYDPASGIWTTDELSVGRSHMGTTTVGDLVFFAGGFTGNLTAHSDVVDILDTGTGVWTTAVLSSARAQLAATSVAGKAIFAGGDSHQRGVDSVDIYDVATATWSTAHLSARRQNLKALTLGHLALFGGGKLGGVPNAGFSDRVDIYDSISDTWETASLSTPRHRLAVATVGNRGMFAGGLGQGVSSSIVLDVVDVFDVQLGTLYCVPRASNSTGLPGILRAEGFSFPAANDLTLIAEQLPPGQFGYFITGLSQGFIQPPGSQGPVCLSGNIGRYNRASEIIQGPTGSLQLDLTSMPVNPPLAALPGDTWNFQCWYRDVNPGPTSNTTNALAVTFATPGIPSVQFAVTQASIIEDTTQVEVRLTLSQPADQDVLVTYAAGGTATTGVDWRVEEPNPFVIPAGQTWADMTLVIAEDGQQEPDEVAIVSLGAPVGAVLGTQTTFTLTIEDDD